MNLLVERLHTHRGVPVVPVSNRHAPWLTANGTVFDVVLAIAASRIQRHRVRFAAVRARDHAARIGRTVAERKVPIQIELVRVVEPIVEGESHSVTYRARADLAPYN